MPSELKDKNERGFMYLIISNYTGIVNSMKNVGSLIVHCKRMSAILAAILMLMLAVACPAASQDQNCHYPGQTYMFSSPAAPLGVVWEYKWTAFDSDSVDYSDFFDKDDERIVQWTVPPDIDPAKLITIYLTVSKITPDVTCTAMDEYPLTLCPYASLTVVKDSLPDDPQDFQFSGTGSIGSFSLDDDGGSDSALSNSQTFDLLPGAYSVTESVELGWMLTAVTCTDGEGNSIPVTLDKTLPAFGETEVTANIDAQYITSGSSLTIVFENTKTAASIDIEKSTNDQDADTEPGPIVAEGSTVTWKYVVTNTGNVDLTNVVVVDDQGVALGEPTESNTDNDILEIGETWTYEATGTAICGQYANLATVTADQPVGDPVSDSDPSHYFGSCGDIDIEKYTNEEDADIVPGPIVAEGSTVTWKYVVTNTGNVDLINVVVVDDQGVTLGEPAESITDNDVLEVGETWTYEATGTASCGQYANLATVTADQPAGDSVSDADPSHYFGSCGDIDIEKYTNEEDADTEPGPIVAEGSTVTWKYVVTNTGNVELTNVVVVDDQGVVLGEPVESITDNDILEVGETWTYEATGTAVCGQYSNLATVTADQPAGDQVSDNDPSHYFGSCGAIDIEKATNGEDADTEPGPEVAEGSTVTWTYVVTNTGNVDLTNVVVVDDQGVVLGEPVESLTDNDVLEVGETWTYEATGTAICGQYANLATVTADQPAGDPVTDEDPSHYMGTCGKCILELNKTALNETVERGQDIYYSIDLCSSCGYDDVILRDVLPNDVELVSVDPPASLTGNTLTWDLGKFPSSPYQRCFNAVVVVRVPIVNMSYDMEQGVQGEGFVNVHNDYDTHHEPKSITNCAYAEAYVYAPKDNLDANTDANLDDNLVLMESVSSCASTRVVDPGTELRRREFGSGTYASEELTRVRMENKSIQSATSLSASHKPTTFSLPGGSSITYGSKWTEKSKGINYATGATINEEYTFANKIDKERVVDLDKNGSTMKTDVTFTGTGHIGVLKKEEPDSHPRVKPTYEAVEDYTGTFRVYELVDEYGSNVRSEKSVTGYGYAAVDKRVSNNQRTYESGTGSYDSEEQIETASNYIAKDINLVYGPTNYSYSPSFATSQNIKWSEGMWSKSGVLAGGVILAALPSSGCGGEAPANTSAPATYISERYSSLNYLDKETVAAGLNEMKTNASFSGMADFRAKATYSNKTGEIDNEERYVGDYDITRKVQITGVSKYGRPHITVTKEGNMTTRWFNKTMANVAEYTITIVNDGNVALAPINIRDIFPPGTEYIYSSIRPDSYSNSEANWSLMNLGVGNSIKLELTLNVTKYAPANLVNRVMVCGMNGDEGCVSGSAYFVLESGDLTCCPPEVVLDKVAQIDATDQTLVHYTIVVQNNANSTVAATLTDMLPIGMNYMSATIEPDIQNGQFLQWIIPTLEPGDVTTIEYQARATMNGAYVNKVDMDATAVDGTGYDTEEAAARVYIGSTGVPPKTTRYGGWQVPDWNMTSPDQGITVSLSPDEDSAAEFPTMYG